MALFSDNPFVGIFRAQKQREAEAALAAQQAMAEQKQAEAATIAQKIQSGDVKRETILLPIKDTGSQIGPLGRPVGKGRMGGVSSGAEARLSELKSSVAYRQADIKSQRRMEENVARGLPFNLDPDRWEKINIGGGYGVKYRFIPSGFGGGWGSVGRPQESTGKTQRGAELGAAGSSGYDLYRKMMAEKFGGPQPAQSILPFTGFGQRLREEEATTGGIRGALGGITSFGGVPMFPFAGQY